MCTVLLFANTMQTVNTQEPRVGSGSVQYYRLWSCGICHMILSLQVSVHYLNKGDRKVLRVSGSGLELQTKVREDFKIMEKAPTRAFSRLKAATTAFAFKTRLRHQAKRALTPR